jgi:hypothetical protein
VHIKSAAGGGSGAGAGGHDGPAKLTGEAYWLEVWAFGTSPHGLGLAAEALWQLTPREYGALKAVWEASRKYLNLRFAELQCVLHNAWFRSKDEHPQAYTVEQFLPGHVEPQQSPADKKLAMTMMMKAAGIQFAPLSERRANGR